MSEGTPSSSASLLNTVCRIYSNGSKCTNCELQDSTNRGTNYMPLRPKSNDDNLHKQVALYVNVCLVNHLGTRRIHLTECSDFTVMQRTCR